MDVEDKLVSVKVIQQKGASALVEWHRRGRTHRVFVPAEQVSDGKCPKSELEAGTAYGESWENYISGLPTVKQIAETLRKRNIWTMDDLFEQPMEAKKIFQSLYGQVFVQFMRATKGGKQK